MANVAEVSELSMSQLSIKSNGSESTTGSQSEDWDKSLNLSDSEDGHDVEVARSTTTPRNSVLFPQNEGNGIVVDSDVTPGKGSLRVKGKQKRSITELVKLQRGDAGEELSPDEASHVAAVLGQWINASSSPYEKEDDFFSRKSQDDLSPALHPRTFNPDGRSRTVSAASNSSRSSKKTGA